MREVYRASDGQISKQYALTRTRIACTDWGSDLRQKLMDVHKRIVLWNQGVEDVDECLQRKNWSGRRVSNSRPQPWQGCALPTELLPHGC